MPDVDGDLQRSAGDETTHPATYAVVEARDLPRGGVEAFVGSYRVLVDSEAEGHDWRERVGELQDADGGDEGGELEEGRDRGCDDEGDGPVDGHDADPEPLAILGREGWGAEEVDEDVVVEDFDPDVAVQPCGDESAHYGQHVADRLPRVV